MASVKHFRQRPFFRSVLPAVFSRGNLFLILLASLGFFPGSVFAQKKPTKQEVEAAFLYNFAKFIEWPSSAFADASSPFEIGVLGDNPFGRDLELTVKGAQPVNGRQLIIKHYKSASDVRDCHILFISEKDPERLKEIFSRLQGKSILTVGEDGHNPKDPYVGKEFTKLGGIVNFFTDDNKIRFEINTDAARQANLKISSKLLNLAHIVKAEEAPK